MAGGRRGYVRLGNACAARTAPAGSDVRPGSTGKTEHPKVRTSYGKGDISQSHPGCRSSKEEVRWLKAAAATGKSEN